MRQVKLDAKNQLSAQKSVWMLFWKVRAQLCARVAAIARLSRVAAIALLSGCRRHKRDSAAYKKTSCGFAAPIDELSGPPVPGVELKVYSTLK